MTGRSLQTLFWMYDVCLYYCLVGCLVVLIPLVQLKTLHQVSYVGALSVIMIIATVLCLMGDAYATWGERQAENVETIIVGADGFGGSFAAITNLVFAYGGQNLVSPLHSFLMRMRPRPLPLECIDWTYP